MAASPIVNPVSSAAYENSSMFSLVILTSLFFIWGFITVLNDILIPHLRNVFDLSYTQAMLIQFCFFAAYFVCSLPAGSLVKRIGYQRGIVAGLLVAALGCLLFLPAALTESYAFFLGALFVLASGITVLQVSANPYVTLLGPAETASRRLNLTQAFNSLGTVVGPLVGGSLILAAVAGAQRGADAVVVPYLGLAAALALLAVVFYLIKLPAIKDSETEQGGYFEVLKHKHLVLGALAIFVYVGAEVSIGSFMINFFGEPQIAGMEEAEAAKYVSYYWLGAMVGRFVGVALMFLIAANMMLAINSIAAIVLLTVVLNTTGTTAMWALIGVGLCNSLMFPTIFSLAVARLGGLTSRGSGVLCMAIVGGALVPLVQGMLADSIGLQPSFILPLICYAYIVYYGLQGFRSDGDVTIQQTPSDIPVKATV